MQGESQAGEAVMNHFLNTGAEGINHEEERFEKSRVSYRHSGDYAPPTTWELCWKRARNGPAVLGPCEPRSLRVVSFLGKVCFRLIIAACRQEEVFARL